MTTEQLRYFLEVARRRSFTEAAHTFYLTQPAITHQISALERELGTKLFLRTTRSVALTRAGELFLEDAKRILDQEDRALERLRQMGGSGQLELKIGYLNSPCRHFLPGLIRDYQERYPQVSLELIRRDATGIQTGADEAEFDLSFSVLSDLQGLSGYACRKLATDFYCLVSPRQHPCVSNASIDYHKLATESFACLSRTAGAYMYKQFQQICRDLEIPLESEGLYLPEEMLMEAGLPCDPDLLDMYLEDGRIVIEPLEGFEEELLEDVSIEM